MDSTTTSKQATILVVSDCPLITNRISTLLKKHFEVHHSTSCNLFNELNKAHLVLFCSTTELCPKLYTKLIHDLDDKRLIILTNPEDIPYGYIGQIVFISLKEDEQVIIQTIKSISSLTNAAQTTIQIVKRHIITTSTQSIPLTKREKEVYKHLTLRNKTIAQILNISPSTVRTHILNINKKVGFDVRQRLLQQV